jgi:hypothetical protein
MVIADAQSGLIIPASVGCHIIIEKGADMTRKVCCGNHAARIEVLEPRRLLSSTPSFVGTYSGTETYTLAGRQVQVPETVTISPMATKSSASKVASTQDPRVVLTALLPLAPEAIMDLIVLVTLFPTDNGKSVSAVEASGNATARSTTGYVASLPPAYGPEGTLQVLGSTLTLSGDLTTGIFPVDSFSFEGTKVTPKKSTASALSQPKRPPITTLGVTQALKASPDLGTFKGHMTRQSDGTVFKTSAVISNNKKGKPAIHFSLVEPGVGTIEIDSEIKPTHTGSFTLDLGDSSIDGIFGGHITHTGRLVLDLTVPGTSILVGSQKRHG